MQLNSQDATGKQLSGPPGPNFVSASVMGGPVVRLAPNPGGAAESCPIGVRRPESAATDLEFVNTEGNQMRDDFHNEGHDPSTSPANRAPGFTASGKSTAGAICSDCDVFFWIGLTTS